MGHGAGHHIEHAEHFEHAAHDQFNTKVTISIAIIAAVLAAVTIQGHRAHNHMLSHRVEASLLRSDASNMDVLAANKWAQFQAYNNRYHTYKIAAEEAAFQGLAPNSEEKRDEAVKLWKEKATEYKTKEMPEAKKEAEEYSALAKKRAAEAEAEKELAEHYHHKADRLDLGDLGLQFGVVLASMAILTKRRSFWFAGIASALIGLAVAMTGLLDVFLGEHGHPAVEHKQESSKDHPEHKGH